MGPDFGRAIWASAVVGLAVWGFVAFGLVLGLGFLLGRCL